MCRTRGGDDFVHFVKLIPFDNFDGLLEERETKTFINRAKKCFRHSLEQLCLHINAARQSRGPDHLLRDQDCFLLWKCRTSGIMLANAKTAWALSAAFCVSSSKT